MVEGVRTRREQGVRACGSALPLRTLESMAQDALQRLEERRQLRRVVAHHRDRPQRLRGLCDVHGEGMRESEDMGGVRAWAG